MKKLSAVVLSLMLCVSMSFAARGGSSSSSSSSSQKKSSSSSSSSSSGSFGLGYSQVNFNQSINGVGNISFAFDEVAGRYWFDDKLAIDVQLGFGSGDATSRFLIGGKVLGNVVSLNNLNVYLFGGLAFGSFTLKTGPQDQDFSLFSIHGGVGAEYYVLPCLSVLTEMGLRYISVKPDGGNSLSDFAIYAEWLPQAGVRYYF
jgi:hypothetical protein